MPLGQVAEHGPVRIRPPAGVLSVHCGRSGLQWKQSGHNGRQRRLSGADRAGDRHELAGRQVQAHVTQGQVHRPG
jgi:hypothetical protein